MATLDRHRVAWTGFAGAPGISTFYFAAGYPVNTALRAFFQGLVNYLPTGCTTQVEPTGDEMDSSTGALIGAWADTAVSPSVGLDSNAYSAVSGALLRWQTATYLSGRRLRGHTYLVPLGGDQYDTSGTLTSGFVTTVGGLMTTLLTATGGSMYVWQRPRLAASAYTDRRGVVHPAITSRGGGYAPVITGAVRSEVTELRTRRD